MYLLTEGWSGRRGRWLSKQIAGRIKPKYTKPHATSKPKHKVGKLFSASAVSPLQATPCIATTSTSPNTTTNNVTSSTPATPPLAIVPGGGACTEAPSSRRSCCTERRGPGGGSGGGERGVRGGRAERRGVPCRITSPTEVERHPASFEGTRTKPLQGGNYNCGATSSVSVPRRPRQAVV